MKKLLSLIFMILLLPSNATLANKEIEPYSQETCQKITLSRKQLEILFTTHLILLYRATTLDP